jgi:hypothetical protein
LSARLPLECASLDALFPLDLAEPRLVDAVVLSDAEVGRALVGTLPVGLRPCRLALLLRRASGSPCAYRARNRRAADGAANAGVVLRDPPLVRRKGLIERPLVDDAEVVDEELSHRLGLFRVSLKRVERAHDVALHVRFLTQSQCQRLGLFARDRNVTEL